VSSNGSGGIAAERVRDVLGADRLLGELVLEGAAQSGVPVRLEGLVQPLDLINPHARPPIRQLGR
jgi:hypothetical protein